MRGNVIDLAVAVVIGAAFTAVVNSVVEKIFNPLIGALFNAESLDNAFNVVIPTLGPGNDAVLHFGAVIGALINFVIVAAVIYFAFVLPINILKKRMDTLRKTGNIDEEAPITELDVLTEIRDLLAKDKQS
nr:large conductance mechanosensitive channel protein MscL [Microbacterium humi]